MLVKKSSPSRITFDMMVVLKHVQLKVDQSFHPTATDISNLLKANMMKTAPTISGKLKRSIIANPVIVQTKYVQYAVGPDVPYDVWVSLGRNAPFGLPWSKSNKKNFRKSTYKGNPYMESAVKPILPYIGVIFAKNLISKLTGI